MDMKRFFLYAIVIAALALAGCGGGGGGTAMMPDPDPDPMPMCPEGQVGTYPDCMDPAPTRTPPPMELVEGIVTANDKDHGPTNPAPYTHADRPGKQTGTNGRDGDVVLLGSLDAASTPANQNNERVKTDGTFGDVSIAEVDVASSGDPETYTNARKLTMTDDVAPSVGRFADGAVFSRTNMGVTDTVYVYETRTAPRARAWDIQYPTTATPTGISGIAAAATTPAGSQSFNVLTFAGDVSGISMRFDSPMLPSGASQTYTYRTATDHDALPTTGPSARGPSDIRGKMFDGMFHGVPGTYTCTDTGALACTVTTNNRGQVITLGGTSWTFSPNNLAEDVTGHMVQGVVNDTDFLTFGYWVQKDDDDGDLTIGVSTFASGSALTDAYVTAMNNLQGMAKYDGKAVGKFVQKTLSPDGMATISDGGTFTADANLTARFGGNAISFNDRFTIIGTIDDFRNDDGDVIDPNWSVTLNKADFSEYDPPTTSTKNTPTTTFTGTTSAGGPAGSWGGGFYGTPMTSAGVVDTPTADNTDAYPTSVAGEFDAHFTNGHALGAFGATR